MEVQEKSVSSAALSPTVNPAKTTQLALRLIRASQTISRVELAARLNVQRSTITEICNPLIKKGFLVEIPISAANGNRPQGRPRIGLALNDSNSLFIGISIGVKQTQVGVATINQGVLGEIDFATPKAPAEALEKIKKEIQRFIKENPHHQLKVVGVSIPGVTDTERRNLVYAPHLGWNEIEIAKELETIIEPKTARIIIENNAAAAAIYESKVRFGKTNSGLLNDFVLIRSGTGIGVGLVLDNEVYRGSGKMRGLAGEFGHMTIVAGGKPCVCGNRGCWERYASASSAASLYLGDRPQSDNQTSLRFLDIVRKAENGEIRAKRTLEKIGEYLGIGIANVIIGVGIPQIIISGRLVYGWKFIKPSLTESINQSMVGKIDGWSVEPGEPTGAELGGALEVAIEEYLVRGFSI